MSRQKFAITCKLRQFFVATEQEFSGHKFEMLQWKTTATKRNHVVTYFLMFMYTFCCDKNELCRDKVFLVNSKFRPNLVATEGKYVATDFPMT